MGDQDIHTEPTQHPDQVASYDIISFPGRSLFDPLRPFIYDQYKPLIFSKWLRSLRFGNELFHKIDSKEYYKNYHAFIELLLSKPDSLVKLAVLSDDHDVVLGFSVSREDVLDYVHVHKDQRRLGIGTALIPAGTTVFTHITLNAIKILGAQPVTENREFQFKNFKLRFNPFA